MLFRSLITGLTALSLIATVGRRVSNKEPLILALAAFALIFAGLSLYVPLFFSRYFLVLMPALYIIVADAIGEAVDRFLPRPTAVYFGLFLCFAVALAVAWPIFLGGDREDWRRPAMAVNGLPACKGASILVVAQAPDDGDPAFLYEHYLDPKMNIHLVPVPIKAAMNPSTWSEVDRQPCPVKVWGGHIEPSEIERITTEVRRSAPGYRIEPFRKSFLMVTGTPRAASTDAVP